MTKVNKRSSRCANCELKSQAVQTLSNKEMSMLEQGCMDISLVQGEKIFIEGMPHAYVVYLREGCAKIHMIGPRGSDQILKIARPGAFVGIQTLLGGDVNDYSATTLEDVKACYIKVEVFKELIKINGEFTREILAYVCREELNYYRRFVDQQQKQINGRLADAILYLSEDIYRKDSFQLPFSHSDLAALIGSTRESVTRALKTFREGKIVEITGRDFRVLKPVMLKKISKSG